MKGKKQKYCKRCGGQIVNNICTNCGYVYRNNTLHKVMLILLGIIILLVGGAGLYTVYTEIHDTKDESTSKNEVLSSLLDDTHPDYAYAGGDYSSSTDEISEFLDEYEGYVEDYLDSLGEGSASKLKGEEYNIGDTITYKDVNYTITGCNRVNDAGEILSIADLYSEEYLVVELSIENNSDEICSLSIGDFSVMNEKGVIESASYGNPDEEHGLDSCDLAPGGKLDCTVAFEIPIDSTGYKMIMEDFWGDPVAVVDLQ